MIILYAIGVAALIVTGQALWKLAVTTIMQGSTEPLRLVDMGKLLTSPFLILGVIVYGVATVAYIYLLSRYKYFQVQSLVVGGSLILTSLVAQMAFKEHISLINAAGIGLIFVGALLIIK